MAALKAITSSDRPSLCISSRPSRPHVAMQKLIDERPLPLAALVTGCDGHADADHINDHCRSC
eukprot:7394681-Karenia_brevis.AAC.1